MLVVAIVVVLTFLLLGLPQKSPTGLQTAEQNGPPVFWGANLGASALVPIALNLSQYFSDPENQPLMFLVDDPAATIAADQLTFTAPANSSSEYVLNVQVSDGVNTIYKPLVIAVEGGNGLSELPVVEANETAINSSVDTMNQTSTQSAVNKSLMGGSSSPLAVATTPQSQAISTTSNSTSGSGQISRGTEVFRSVLAAPTISQVILNSTSGSGATQNVSRATENLTVFVINASDADNDSVQNITDWRVNGTSFAVLNMPFETNVSSTSSGAIRDYSSFVNNGTLGGGTAANAPVWNASGKVGGAYTFDGVNDRVEMANSASLNLTQRLSISAWVRTTDTAGMIVNKDDTGSNRQYAFLITASNARLAVFQNSVTLSDAIGTSNVSNGNWHNIVGTIDISGDGKSRIYVDGVLETTASVAISSIASTARPVWIGEREANSNPLGGSIDEVLIFNRSISASQVYQLYFDGNQSHHPETIVSSELSVGNNWSVAVTPNDNQNGSDGTTVVSNGVVVQANNHPTIQQVVLNSSTGTGALLNTSRAQENLTVFVINASDADNDGVQNITDWRINGSSFAVLNMPFETSSSSVSVGGVRDYSSFVNNGTLGGGTAASAPVWNASGKVGGAFTFDGVDDFINVGSAGNASGDFTVAAWIKTGSDSNFRFIAGDREATGSEKGWEAFVFTDDKFYIQGGNGVGSAGGSSNVRDSAWHHVVGGRQDSSWFAYVDGVLEGSSVGTSGSLSTSASTLIGKTPSGNDVAGRRFNGSIDEVLIFNRSLSSQEISQLYRDQNRSKHLETVVSQELSGGQNWSVAVTPNDKQNSSDGSTVLSNGVVIQANNHPTIQQVILNSTTGTGATQNISLVTASLSVFVINVSDVDNDGVQNVTDWRVNGTSVAVLNMPFETSSSSVSSGGVRDYSLFVNNGTLGGGVSARAPVWNVSGRAGGAYMFDGSNDFINISHNQSLNPNGGDFTVSVWVRTSHAYPTDSDIGNVVWKGQEGITNSHYELVVRGGSLNGTYFQYRVGAPAGELMQSLVNISSNISDGSWHQIVATVDEGAGVEGRLYFDGGEVGNRSSFTLAVNPSQSMVLGAEVNASGGLDLFYNGSMDEVLILNRSLSAGQVRQLYLDGSAGHHAETFVSQELSVGNNWSVAVTPNDQQSASDGTTVVSNSVTIVSADTCPLNITSSTTLINDLTSDGTCITIGADNIVLDCAGFTINYSNTQPGSGINATDRANITIQNCRFIQGSSIAGANANAISFTRVNDSIVKNSIVNVTLGGFGVLLSSSRNNNIANNTFTSANSQPAIKLTLTSVGNNVTQNTVTASQNNDAFSIAGGSSSNVVNSNMISNYGLASAIVIDGASSNTLTNNTIFGNGDAIGLQNGCTSNTIANNNATTNATENFNGAYSDSGCGSNTVSNNVFTATNISNGIRLIFYTTGNIFTNNTVSSNDGIAISLSNSNRQVQFISTTAYSNTGTAIRISNANNTVLTNTNASTNTGTTLSFVTGATQTIAINTTLFTNATWIETDNASTGNNITNTLFVGANGSILIINTTTIPANATVNVAKLNVTFNKAFLNSTNLSFLNTSAQITLGDLNSTLHVATFDGADSGVFATCPGTRCTRVSDAAGTFVYNVTRFTSYSSSEAMTCPLTINTSTTLTNDLTSNGTCITIGANNVVLDCVGFTINYSNTLDGYGVNATNRTNITVENCTIIEGNSSISSAHGIFFSGTNNSRILQNFINATGESSGIHLQDGSTNNTLNDNTVYAGFEAIRISFSNRTTLNNNRLTGVSVGITTESSDRETILNTIATGSGAVGTGVFILDATNGVYTNNTGTGALRGFRYSGQNSILVNNSGASPTITGFLITQNTVTSQNNTFVNTVGSTESGTAIGIFAHKQDTFTNTTAIANTGTALSFASSTQNNTLANTTIYANSTWLTTDSASTGNNITNTLFIRSNGSIQVINATTIPASTTVNLVKLNITFNRAFLNSSNLSFLNTSAQITLHSLNFTVPRAIVDLGDNGTFITCNATRCQNVSYNGSTFVFNVTSFTTYAANETVASLTLEKAVVTCNAQVNQSATSAVLNTCNDNGGSGSPNPNAGGTITCDDGTGKSDAANVSTCAGGFKLQNDGLPVKLSAKLLSSSGPIDSLSTYLYNISGCAGSCNLVPSSSPLALTGSDQTLCNTFSSGGELCQCMTVQISSPVNVLAAKAGVPIVFKKQDSVTTPSVSC